MTKADMLRRIIELSNEIKAEAIRCGISKKNYDKRLKHLEAQKHEDVLYTYNFYVSLYENEYKVVVRVRGELPPGYVESAKAQGITNLRELVALRTASKAFADAYRRFKKWST